MDFCNLEIVNSSFADVTFRRNILRNVKFKKCKASNLSMQEVSVDVESTVLEIDMIDPIGAFLGGLIAYNYKGSHEGKSLYTPQEISSALVKIGLIESSEEGPTERAVNHEYVEMLSKLERGFRRSNIICMDDKQYMQIFSAKKWEQLRDALLENKLLKLEHRKTSGSKKMFLRRVTPIDVVMKGLRKGSENDEKIEAFWSSLEKTS